MRRWMAASSITFRSLDGHLIRYELPLPKLNLLPLLTAELQCRRMGEQGIQAEEL